MSLFILGFVCGMVFPFAAAFIVGGIQDWFGRKHWLTFGQYRTLMYFPDGVRMERVKEQRVLGHRIVRILPKLWWFSHRPDLLDVQIKSRQETQDRLIRESQARLATLKFQATKPDATPGPREGVPGDRNNPSP